MSVSQHKHRKPNGGVLVKIAFPVAEDAGGGYEMMWCSTRGAVTYRLENIPAYAFGFAFHDVIRASAVAGSGRSVEAVVLRGGGSTYRALPCEGQADECERALAGLRSLGCGMERNKEDGLVGIDVPPWTDIHAVYELLESGLAAGVWLFDEMFVGHALRA